MLSKFIAAKPAEPSAGNEATALADLVAWSEACPAWQRDALRRLCEKGELGAEDFNELAAICKGEAGAVAKPIEAGHVRAPAAASVPVTLRSIHDVTHVNALAEGEALTFEKVGLTIIYGDNGSGKSGYARILKKACRAREAGLESILPNIYAAKPGTPTATIEFTVNGQNKSDVWVLGKEASPYLSAVRVFDSRAANVHVDKSNQLAYTPLPVKVLIGLAGACQMVRERITQAVERLKDQTPAAIKAPACNPATAVGNLISRLAKAKPSEVDALAALSDDERARLAQLRTDLANDPARTGKQLLARKVKLDAAIQRIESMTAAASDEKIAALDAACQAHTAARAAAQAASADLFAKEPLPQIGSDVWRELWRAAQAYSEQQAYHEHAFPVTGEGARCVLCLQELGKDASDRLNRFDSFVKDESKRREAATLDAYRAARWAVDLATPPKVALELVNLVGEEFERPDLARGVRAAVVTALRRSRLALRPQAADRPRALVKQLDAPLEALREASATLQTRADALMADANSEAQRAMVAARDELSDREWLAGIKDDVIAEIGRRAQIAHLEKAGKETVTTRITTKSGEVADALVTAALRAQFAKEVARLGAADLAIELRKEKSKEGVPLFRVVLIKKPEAKLGDVLSEGEYRSVALAAFLAELGTESVSTIVFDDPVSSLDHLHREGVAKRLAEESKKRQVVVLTHDIAFLFLLTEMCRDAGASVGFRSISRGPEVAGFCKPNAPSNAQPIEKAIDSMAVHLANTKRHYERGEQAEWHRVVRSLEEQLRTGWERCVEEALSPVFRRLSHKVNTGGLVKLTVLTPEDCASMREAYGRCSKLLHSAPDVLQPALPKPEAIEAEINTLRAWLADLRARQDKVKAA